MKRVQLTLHNSLLFRLSIWILAIGLRCLTPLNAAEATPQKITLAELANRMPELAKSKDQRQFTLTAKVAFVKTVPVPAFKNNDFDIFELTDGPKKALIGFTYNKTVSPMADYQAKKEANRAMVQSLKKGGSFTITISISSFALLSDAQPAVLHAATPAK